MAVIRLRAPAKLNLGLEILARRADGYHEIQTLFVPLRLFDELEIWHGSAPGIQLEVVGADLPAGEENLAVRAARRACEALGVAPALALRIEKRIPIAAGLGGGSSDAAAAIVGVEELVGARLPVETRRQVAREIGADVPFFLQPRPSLGLGIGEHLVPLCGVPEMHWLLVSFSFPVSTPWAYREASRELTLPREGSSIAALLGPGGTSVLPRNDLEPSVVRCHPEIATARDALKSAGAQWVGMSGSGPTVYGRFESRTEAERVSHRLRLPNGARTIVVSSPSSASGRWGWGVAKR